MLLCAFSSHLYCLHVYISGFWIPFVLICTDTYDVNRDQGCMCHLLELVVLLHYPTTKDMLLCTFSPHFDRLHVLDVWIPFVLICTATYDVNRDQGCMYHLLESVVLLH